MARTLLLGASLCAAAGAAAGATGTPGAMCATPLVIPPRPFARTPPEVKAQGAETTYLSARRATTSEQGESVLVGDVKVLRGDLQASAARVVYHRQRRWVDATGGVQIWKGDVYITGPHGTMDLAAKESALYDARYIAEGSHAHGRARAIRLTGSDLMRITGGTYTTCDPGDAFWTLHASYLRLNKTTEIGTAHNVVVEIHGVPVFYTPYLTFPLSKRRKTGFLRPTVGVSGSNGVQYVQPYYWNIAPNLDATLTARAMSSRGVMLEGQYRYLEHFGTGEIDATLLPRDLQTGTPRGSLFVKHNGSFAPHWYASVDAGWVSDKNYVPDFSTDLSSASTSYIQRLAELTYYGNGWYASGLLQNWQTVDPSIPATSRPYQRLPQLYFSTNRPEQNRRFNLGLTGEAVYFYRDAGETGARLDLRPSVSFPWRTTYSFVVPKLTVDYTRYALSGLTPVPGQPLQNAPSRTTPIFDVDSGLYLDRPLHIAGGDYVQTLEPRMYYLLVPYQNQSDLPVFDTGLYTFSFAQLFRNNRFSGVDRIGDANQLTTAVTTRLLDARSGRELMHLSLGQIQYFRAQRVTLPGTPELTTGSSDVVAEAGANLRSGWRFNGDVDWSPQTNTVARSALSVQYRPDPMHIVNAAYYSLPGLALSPGDDQQTDVSFRWPLARSWSAVGRWNYALTNRRTLEVFGGLEYDSCCWALRVVVRRYLNGITDAYNTGFFVQLELKGLTGVGTGAVPLLERGIPGYRPVF